MDLTDNKISLREKGVERRHSKNKESKRREENMIFGNGKKLSIAQRN